MSTYRSSETAQSSHPLRRLGGAAIWLFAGLCPIAMAQIPLPSTSRPSIHDYIERMLEHPDAVVRGEAALGLATTRKDHHHDAILKVARDKVSAARIRGILAMGILGSPGSESFLGDLLLDAPRGTPEQTVAALSLGLLPDTDSAPAIDAFFQKIQGGSYKRNAELLSALLYGLSKGSHPSKLPFIQRLLDDASNKIPELRRLAIAVLANVPDSLDSEETSSLLHSSMAEDRIGILNAIQNHKTVLEQKDLKYVSQLARKSNDSRVRVSALTMMTKRRQPEALDIGVRALRTSNPEEASAAVETCLHFGSGPFREALERRILSTHKPAVQEAMLQAFRPPASKGFVGQCLSIASDRKNHLGVRVQAAALAARAKDPRSTVMLRSLFRLAEDPLHLTALANACAHISPESALAEELFPPRTARDLRLLPARIHALLKAEHLEALPMLRKALAMKGSPATLAGILRAYRMAQLPLADSKLFVLLPEVPATLLR